MPAIQLRSAAAILLLLVTAACAERTEPVVPVSFTDATDAAGLRFHSWTFGVVVTDVDNDGDDDLFLGNHGSPPALFLQQGERFNDASNLVGITDYADRHGYTFVDLDNDGDKDFVYAGGGADGVGAGKPNEVYRNLLRETGALAFANTSTDSDIAYRTMRSRTFLPLASAEGDRVDLYLTSLHKGRPGSTNLLFKNHSDTSVIRLNPDPSSTLNRRLESDGKDIFFDFDRDGLVDYLQMRLPGSEAVLYRQEPGGFEPWQSELAGLPKMFVSAEIADFNNDGYPDLYLGASNGHTGSDNVSANNKHIHFVVHSQQSDPADAIAFKTSSKNIRINFQQHLAQEGRDRVDASDIFLGVNKSSPKTRRTKVLRKIAQGKPDNFDQPGTYIWYDKTTATWHLRWVYGSAGETTNKGSVSAAGMELLKQTDLEVNPPKTAQDYILINEQGKAWRPLYLSMLQHQNTTNQLTAADFNNDGWIDIAGVRSNETGAKNGTPFIVLNHGDLTFSVVEPLSSPDDDIFQADTIVHGFFNDDGLPDLFITNGYGLLPGHEGPYALWLNRTATDNGHLLLELEGSTANRDAIGAQVEVYSADDRLLGYRELGPGYGRGQDTHKLHFGLGTVAGPYRVEIRWPGASSAQSLVLENGGLHRIRQP